MSFTAAVIGLGRVGLGYDLRSGPDEVLSHAKAYLTHRGLVLVGGADPEASRRREFSAFSGRPAYADTVELLDRHRPQIVSVCAPTDEHWTVVETIAGFEPRLIVCEKPLAGDPVSGRRIVELCRRRGIALAVNYMRRFDPAVASLGARLRSGELGAIYKGVGYYSKGLLHNGGHAVDLLLDWLGPARSFRVLRPGTEPDVSLSFENGCEFFLLSGRESDFSVMDLELLGGRGRVRYSRLGESIECWAAREDALYSGYRTLVEAPAPQPALSRCQAHMADAVFRFLERGEPLASNGDSALAVLELCASVEAEARCGVPR